MSFDIYKTKCNLQVVGNEIHSLEAHFGCDGERHALCMTKVYMDNYGNITFAEALGEVVIGECDGSCEVVQKLGGFIIKGELERSKRLKVVVG